MNSISKIYQQFLLSDGVSTDSRENVTNKIFFALSGENFNGNKFVDDAVKKGARLCVIDDSGYQVNDCIIVDNVLLTLQQLAKHHRKQCSATVLAITGTNGKTTTKELISSVLSTTKPIISTQGNFNNHIGVPLTLLRIVPTTEIAVVEMGANHNGEIKNLCEIAKPDIGIITNIGKAHLEGFGSFDGVISAKNELYKYLKNNNGKAIVNSDDKLLAKLSLNIPQFKYGANSANVVGKIVEFKPNLKIVWGYGSIVGECSSQLYGKYNYENIMAAVATGLYFGVNPVDINKAIEEYIPESNRSQKIITTNNSILLDAYNANPTSLRGAITSFSDYQFENPYLILGDMFELGNFSANEHQTIVNLLLETKIENVILVGQYFSKTRNHNFLTFATTEDAAIYLGNNKIENANILIKGSRGMKLELLVKEL